ncbi:hypothetical protein [Methylobacterium radiotolerans]|uniref:hypothetical protein n=1 Tax=Methylobacterium radiotolerans TaxID=31998 RepID=UPI0015F6A382|nr:hypothetical protein [Methylobacterium radiotolerans]
MLDGGAARKRTFTAGPGGVGASAFQDWLTLPGNAGKTKADFMASLKGADGLVRSIEGVQKPNLTLNDIGAAPVRLSDITRALIPSFIVPAVVMAFSASGFAAAGDYGSGARYIRGTSAGPLAIQDGANAWFQLDLSAPEMYAGWFGVQTGIPVVSADAIARGKQNLIGLNAVKPYLTTGRKLYMPPGKVAIVCNQSDASQPAWELGDGTTTSVATTAGWSVVPAGGCSTPGRGELGGPGGTELVAVGPWGTGYMFRLNGPIPGVIVDLTFDCAGIAPGGPDVIHAFRSKLYLTTQGYTGAFGATLRTIDGPRFSGLTQGFMECEGEIVCTQPANNAAEGVYLKACESTLPSTDPAYYYQGFSRNRLRIKAEIPGAAGKAGIVVDRIDNNSLPMCFPFPGANPLQAGSGGVRGIISNDGFFPCENDFSGGHIVGGFIGQWGSGGNFAVPYSTSDGEPLPALGSNIQFWTHTGLMGFLRRIYGDRSGTLAGPTFTFGAWQGSGMSVDDATGAVRIGSIGVLGLQCDPSGRVGLGMAPVAGYGASVSGDLNLSGGSRTIAATSGSFLQIQAPTTVYLTTAAVQRLTADASGITVAGAGVFSGPVKVPAYTVATLPTPGTSGRIAKASNGCALKSGGTVETSGAGTGCIVEDSGSAWRIIGTNITVSA